MNPGVPKIVRFIPKIEQAQAPQRNEQDAEDRKLLVGRLAGAIKLLQQTKRDHSFRSISQAANHLNIKPGLLFRFMDQHGWTLRLGWRRVASLTMVRMGYLTRKVLSRTNDDGTRVEFDQVLVTPQGLMALAKAMKFISPASAAALEMSK